MLDCLALVASICINQSAQIEVVREAGWVGAAIILTTGKITIESSGDAIDYASRKDVVERCAKSCFIYSQECDSDVGTLRCVIYFASDYSKRMRRLVIESATEEKLSETKASAKLCLEECHELSSLSRYPVGAFPPFRRSRGQPAVGGAGR